MKRQQLSSCCLLSSLPKWVGRGCVYALDAFPRYSTALEPACVFHVVFTITLPHSPVICGKWLWVCGVASALGGREACESPCFGKAFPFWPCCNTPYKQHGFCTTLEASGHCTGRFGLGCAYELRVLETELSSNHLTSMELLSHHSIFCFLHSSVPRGDGEAWHQLPELPGSSLPFYINNYDFEF